MVTFQRHDVEFSSDRTVCRAWLYQPSLPGALPCIVMANGFGGTRDTTMEPYAGAFAAAGYAVLVFDYRHFGASDGEPRQLASIPWQLTDWASAVGWARRQPTVDPRRIALWGSSFSGGHVVMVAARDRDIAAVSAQVPMMDGLAAGLMVMRYAGLGVLLRLVALGVLDGAGSLLGRPPVYVPLVGPPGEVAAMSSRDAEAGHRRLVGPSWRNQVVARVVPTIVAYRPIRHAHRIRCPVLIILCKDDTLTPNGAARALARKLGPRAEIREYDMGHFDIYEGEGFARSSSDEIAFFDRVLKR
jgi:dienelactone hydrolase